MKYRLAIFDFDGTLADTFPFFVRVFNQLADAHDFRRIDPAEIPALRHYNARQMMRHVRLPAWKFPLVAKDFIALMRRDVASIALFDEIDAVLHHLSDAGLCLAVVSANADDNVRHVLGPVNTRLISQFECGMSIFGKPARIRKVLRRARVPAGEAIYIGDQATDIDAARKVGVAFGAVAWGYGSIESLRALGPDEEFDCVAALRRLG